MIRPPATALTTRRTPTVPISSSTRTSTNVAQWLLRVYGACLTLSGTDSTFSSML